MAITVTERRVCVSTQYVPSRSCFSPRHAHKALQPPFLGGSPPKPTCIQINTSKGWQEAVTQTKWQQDWKQKLTLSSPNNSQSGSGSDAWEIKDIIVTFKKADLKKQCRVRPITPTWHTVQNEQWQERSVSLETLQIMPHLKIVYLPIVQCPNWLLITKLVFLVSLSIFSFLHSSSFFLSFYHTCFCTMKTKLLRYFNLISRHQQLQASS